MRTPLFALLLGMVLVIACGDDGPDDDGLAGRWTYQAGLLSNPGYEGSCRIAAVPISLTVAADSIHGMTNDETFLICQPSGGLPDTTSIIASELSILGAKDEDAISFQIYDGNWSHTGELSDGELSGTISFRIPGGTGSDLTFEGNWQAVRD